MTKLILLPHSEPIDMKWDFGFGELNDQISQRVQDALTESFKVEPPDAWLPFEWGDADGIGGPCPEDPLTIYISFPVFSPNFDYGVVWSVRLETLMIDSLELWSTGDEFDWGQKICPEYRPAAEQLRDALRALADKIDATIPDAKPSSGRLDRSLGNDLLPESNRS